MAHKRAYSVVNRMSANRQKTRHWTCSFSKILFHLFQRPLIWIEIWTEIFMHCNSLIPQLIHKTVKQCNDVFQGEKSHCGFWSNRTVLYFPLSVRPFVRPSVTGVTYKLFSIFWRFIPLKTIYFLNAYHLGLSSWPPGSPGSPRPPEPPW